ncbi:TonB-dependent receptor [Sessilibacter sp. MAH4]
MAKPHFYRTKLFIAANILFCGYASAQSSYQLEEVVVTAQKRQQSAQDVSIAVTAFDSSSLEKLGVNQPADIALHTPNLNVKNVLNKSAPIFTIRGIGNAAFTSNSVAPVGVYVDELFLPTNTMMSFSVFDIEQVEVLKGPQGTLFGRNTTAGAVSFATARPAHDNEGYIKVGGSNFDGLETEAAQNISLSDTVAMRLSGKWTRQDEGTFTNVNNGGNRDVGTTNTYAIRAGFLFELENGEVYFNVHGGQDKSENEPWVGIGRSALDDPSGAAPELPGVDGQQYRNNCLDRATNSIQNFINNPNCVNRVGYYDENTDPRVGEFSLNPKIEADSFGLLLNTDFALTDTVDFASITAYELLDKTTQEDFDGSPFRIGDTTYRNDIEVFSQEFRFSSVEPYKGVTDWITGFIYYQDTQDVTDLYGYTDRVNHDVLVDFTQETVSVAGYLHTETQLSEKFRLIAGVRISYDNISFDGGTTAVNFDDDFTGDVTFFSVNDPILVDDEDIESTELTGKIGIDYNLAEDILLYANYSRGYKAGVWNGFWAASPGDHSSAEPEFIDAYEIGFKSTLLDQRLRLNAAAYLYDYKDQQLFADLPDGRFTIFNAGSADVQGAEVEINWLVTPNFELRGGVGYTDANVSASVGLLEFDDAQPANTPEYTYNLLARYSFEFGQGFSGYVQSDYSYQDDVFFSVDNLEAISQDGYGLLGFRAGVEAPQGWEISAWIKNAEDELYFTEILTSGSAGVVSGQVGTPRTYGVSFKTHF